MIKLNNKYHIYEISVGADEQQPVVGQEIEAVEWDEMGSYIHKINIGKIMDVKAQQNADGVWYFDYIIKSYHLIP